MPSGGCRPSAWSVWTGRWWLAGASCCGCWGSMSGTTTSSDRTAASRCAFPCLGSSVRRTAALTRSGVVMCSAASSTNITRSQHDESGFPRPIGSADDLAQPGIASLPPPLRRISTASSTRPPTARSAGWSSSRRPGRSHATSPTAPPAVRRNTGSTVRRSRPPQSRPKTSPKRLSWLQVRSSMTPRWCAASATEASRRRSWPP